MYVTDTIAAISTAVGEGGIGIVRISGPEAIEIVEEIFVSKKEKSLVEVDSYTAHYGQIIDPRNQQIVDEVITLVMKAPKTYTTEDIVEIDCHGGPIVVQKILDVVLHSGARLADPGEFTKRAFLNGRIDLAQAEAIIDLIRSQTEVGLEVAIDQLEGGLSKKVDQIKQDIVSLLAHLEATIDFPEDEIEDFNPDQLGARINEAIKKTSDLLATSQRGKILKEGLEVAIIGKPNVGKSSLLNALLRERRAIVTEVPGTTRDVIEEVINIDGIPLKIIDTAGIRKTEDKVEKIGVEKSEQFLKRADLVLLVVDINQGITTEDRDLIKLIKDKKKVVVANKFDLDNNLNLDSLEELLPETPIVKTSAIENEGIDRLEDVISDLVFSGDIRASNQTLITNMRHKNALDRAHQRLLDVRETFEKRLPNDFITIDLRAALEAVGEVTGDTIGEDIIDQIFADFCLGK
ncbi:tRNA uridine-5-carboxymethylaminomethyl(34) synthesis GTPase MnmE [Natroniella sulfidigena]|uniref:tRNA uridine-5-carboxymethylaminomethyl(34) synthesis GTPase MnmE n=1 Tax=Natroniella sulfidigena TaxID=723921 RepID=UPI00200A7398|nr:tRNA uridine-5-carboxymethylaminomethyl(34) synthesis GTPase MnmE [Natroniella sulfidigena]MCK8816619.1 tRNA uridine-5-carboxymethylaminomethyl(34) synthesis GTPase MnmE [Natroniella sulfidigena]